jgi:hypothetical protein
MQTFATECPVFAPSRDSIPSRLIHQREKTVPLLRVMRSVLSTFSTALPEPPIVSESPRALKARLIHVTALSALLKELIEHAKHATKEENAVMRDALLRFADTGSSKPRS